MPLVFQATDDIKSIYFNQALAIYVESFPANERHSIEVIRQRVESRKSILHVVLKESQVVAMALTWRFEQIAFMLLDYIAVKEGFRGKEAGSQLFNAIYRYALENNRSLIMEVEKPGVGTNSAERKKRVQFYLKNGAFIMQNVPYILPALDDTEPTEMILMMVPYKIENYFLDGNQVQQLVKSLYNELYNRNENDKLLQSFIHYIPNPVSLKNTI